MAKVDIAAWSAMTPLNLTHIFDVFSVTASNGKLFVGSAFGNYGKPVAVVEEVTFTMAENSLIDVRIGDVHPCYVGAINQYNGVSTRTYNTFFCRYYTLSWNTSRMDALIPFAATLLR